MNQIEIGLLFMEYYIFIKVFNTLFLQIQQLICSSVIQINKKTKYDLMHNYYKVFGVFKGLLLRYSYSSMINIKLAMLSEL